MGNLVLSRRAGESVAIGEKCIFSVRDVHLTKAYIVFTGAAWQFIRVGETLDTGECTITLCSTQRGAGKFLFTAAAHVKIVRTELLK